MSTPWLWYISRASGVVTLVLLTLVVLLGLLTAAHLRPRGTVPVLAVGLHRTLALGTTVFLAAHILTAVTDSYVHLGWLSPVVPFVSGYRRLPVGLGAWAFDIFVALIVTSLLRHRLPDRAWRVVHRLAYALAPIAEVHALLMATTSEPILLSLTVSCGLAMTAAAGWRWWHLDANSRRRAEIASQEWS
ncbi:ferric reductase-like transmembrane domain-containing protein [Nocardia sp. BMG111209]|uniref:ferric reductase-like transmembrane domain-containing protein n=1 Tax=Nocardia sp. BMG111209 TaxID=1160137 RepID=UPI00037E8371|nr:ferric reductase-like transmembrane domain-containing protein [Nocardia sp. BMG111209]